MIAVSLFFVGTKSTGFGAGAAAVILGMHVSAYHNRSRPRRPIDPEISGRLAASPKLVFAVVIAAGGGSSKTASPTS